MSDLLTPEHLLLLEEPTLPEILAVLGTGKPDGVSIHEVVPDWLRPLGADGAPAAPEEDCFGAPEAPLELRERGYRDWVAPVLLQGEDDGLFDVVFDFEDDEPPSPAPRSLPKRRPRSPLLAAPETAARISAHSSRAARRYWLRTVVQAHASEADQGQRLAG